ncbi:hypothetical protein MNBD_GAMMA26-972 [hydrothermal vent metagenome]|uniref:Uncharacterized protein n=1 Tax=hydrothermal vent metagenome TaxID=652676 RepID=A0A3B1BJ20_9ZZZZ
MTDNQRLAFLNEWQGGDEALLIREFEICSSQLFGADILLASHMRDEFCGEAFVLFRRQGMLYEVNASHDSDGRIEGQWEPEETSVDVLRHRLEQGRLGSSADGSNMFADELRFLLAELECGAYI